MKSVLFASIIAIIFVSGEARKCYSSLTVGKPSNTSIPSTPCLIDEEPCVKVTIGLKNGTEIVGRDCLSSVVLNYDGLLGKEFQDPMAYEILRYSSVHLCDTDNCNGVQSIIAVFSIIFASLFVSIFSSY